MVKADRISPRHYRMLGNRGLQGLAAAEVGLGQGSVRAGGAARSGQRAMASDSHEQLLRAAIRGHVARCGMAPQADAANQVRRNKWAPAEGQALRAALSPDSTQRFEPPPHPGVTCSYSCARFW